MARRGRKRDLRPGEGVEGGMWGMGVGWLILIEQGALYKPKFLCDVFIQDSNYCIISWRNLCAVHVLHTNMNYISSATYNHKTYNSSKT